MNKLVLSLSALCALSACLLAGLPGVALADGQRFSSDGLQGSGSPAIQLPDPNRQSAGDQYVETVPTSRGPRAPGRGRRATLPRAVVHELRQLGGGDASTLESVATSPAYGAPAASPRHARGRHPARQGRGVRSERSAPAVPSAALGAVGGGDARLGWLVLAVLATTALALGAAGYQRHRDRGTGSGGSGDEGNA